MKPAGLAAVIVLILFAVAQFIRPPSANPPIDPHRVIQAQVGMSELGPILDRACADCHSNRAAAWPWYAKVAPLSWAMAYGVEKGRAAVNFSEWAGYSPDRQRALLALVCQDVSQGKMPGSAWTSIHPEARLSRHDIETICAAAREGR
jgi:hypothetical protein